MMKLPLKELPTLLKVLVELVSIKEVQVELVVEEVLEEEGVQVAEEGVQVANKELLPHHPDLTLFPTVDSDLELTVVMVHPDLELIVVMEHQALEALVDLL